MEPSGAPPRGNDGGAEAGTPPRSLPRSPPPGPLRSPPPGPPRDPPPGPPRPRDGPQGPDRGRKRPPGGHREPPPGGKRHKTGEPCAGAPPPPSDGDRLFAQKCRELRGFIRPLTELLNGLKTGRYDKGLSTFQQSVAMDRIQRIIGVLQKPEMGARYLGTLLQVEVMLRGWFPHVAPKAGPPPGAQDRPPQNPDPPGGAWGPSPSPVGVLLLLHDRLRARRGPPGGDATAAAASGTPGTPRHGGGAPQTPPPNPDWTPRSPPPRGTGRVTSAWILS
ncbi:circadian-associated transcriptional repressor [Anser cygnoides]|uniref:circadian-associated transcriptional repressor n=1 Tax=Anser cygnoides TaxID=8845 RepID=UPI0034D2BEB4